MCSVRTLEGHTGWVRSASFGRDGNTLVSCGDGSDGVRVWDVAAGECLQTLWGHVGVVSSVQFSPDGLKLVSAGADNCVRVW